MTLQTGKLGFVVHGDLGEEHYEELMHQWRMLDAIINITVQGYQNSSFGGDQNGDCYLVREPDENSPWYGENGKIARYNAYASGNDNDGWEGEWEFFEPRYGWQAWNNNDSTMYRYNGDWEKVGKEYSPPMESYSNTKELSPDDVGKFIMINTTGAKTITFPASQILDVPEGAEFQIMNSSASGNLTIVDGWPFTVKPPPGGSKVIPPGGVVTLKRVGNSEYVMWGHTVAA